MLGRRMCLVRCTAGHGLLSVMLAIAACGDDGAPIDDTDTSGTEADTSTSSTGMTTGVDESTTDGDTTTGVDASTTDASTTTMGGTTQTDTGANTDPLAEDDRYIVLLDDLPLVVDAANGVLANDSDVDGDTLVVDAADTMTAVGGTIDVSPDGSFTYTPPDPFWGEDRFSYTVGDGNGGTATAQVRIIVVPTTLALGDVAGGFGGFAIDGEAGADESGYAVAGCGDIDGDGLTDVVIGAPNAGGTGRAYVVFGKADTTTVSLADVAAGVGGFVIAGQTSGDAAGWSVAVVGDVDGDGLADIAVGAPDADRAYVVFGKADTSSVSLSDVAAGSGGYAIVGSTGEALGSSIAAAGDVDGDGLADVIIGAPAAAPQAVTNAGRAYVVFGKASTTSVQATEIATGTGGFVIDGVASQDGAGDSVGGGGDVDGDGLADVLVGAPQADPNGSGSGRIYVVHGKTDTAAVDLVAVAAGMGGFVLDGEAGLDNAGNSVAMAGDVDGDGLADIIVGAPGAEDDTNLQGRSYVVFGKVDTNAVSLSDVVAGQGGFVLDGQSEGDLSGWSVAGAGDVDADGLADVIVGAQSGDYAGGTSGRTYVVWGKSDTAAVDLTEVAAGVGGFALDGEGSLHASGWSVDGSADVDGDGFADVVIGAYLADPGATNAGRSYVVFGGDFRGFVTGLGTDAADQLGGTAGVDVLVGGPGDDELVAGGGADVLYGGPGDDLLIIGGFDFFRIDGGTGVDTLALDGAGLGLDLTNYYDAVAVGIEVVDLTGTGDNDLFLDLRDLRALSGTSTSLTVVGDAGDGVVADLSGAGFVQMPPNNGLVPYTNGVLTLFVHEAVEQFVQL